MNNEQTCGLQALLKMITPSNDLTQDRYPQTATPKPSAHLPSKDDPQLPLHTKRLYGLDLLRRLLNTDMIDTTIDSPQRSLRQDRTDVSVIANTRIGIIMYIALSSICLPQHVHMQVIWYIHALQIRSCDRRQGPYDRTSYAQPHRLNLPQYCLIPRGHGGTDQLAI